MVEETHSGKTPDGLGIGAELQKTREERGQSLAELSEILRIREDHLRALEEEAFENLPGKAYVIGFLRTYAAHLGISDVELVARYKQSVSEVIQEDVGFVEDEEEKRLSNSMISLITLGALLLVYLFWLLIGNADDAARARSSATQTEQTDTTNIVPPGMRDEDSEIEETRTIPATDTPAPTREKASPEASPNPILAPPTSQAQITVALRATRRTWMRVETPDRRVLFTGVAEAGEGVELNEAFYILTTRDAGGLAYFVGGEKIGALGGRGRVLTNQRISRAVIISLSGR